MTLEEILAEERKIWPESLDVTDIAVRLAVMVGDVARVARGAHKDAEEDVGKELGNFITSCIRWCDDMGLDVDECVELALQCQRQYRKEGNE